MKSVLIALISIVSSLSAQSVSAAPSVIYGEDNRKDLYEVLNPNLVQLADSTVALVNADDLNQNSSGMVQIQSQTLIQRMNACSGERFANQPSGAFCSGSLIGKNILLTAGHCITDQSDCKSTKFVFGYSVKENGKFPSSVPEQDVVGCKSIIKRDQVATGADYAIILLDREINHHNPLRVAKQRRTVNIENGTRLVMIGHPSGLPTKIDDGGKVRDNSLSGYFSATTDSYGGNSGSAVFNYESGEIEGILVRGERDYVPSSTGCQVSKVCSETGCRGEDVTKISVVLPFLPSSI